MSARASSDWTLNLTEATATHVSGVTVVAMPASGRRRYRVMPLPGTLPVPGMGLSEEDYEFLAQVMGERVREGCRLLLEQLRRHRLPTLAIH
ncbi:hypothetical protein [Lysobacter humi (ex Lee et al. 2017)]